MEAAARVTRRLAASHEHARAADYLRPGGPWDVPVLDAALAGADDADIASVAGGLVAQGVGRGDVVSWQMPNRRAAMLLYRACWRIGAVAAPVHHLAGERDVAACRAQVHPALVVEPDTLPAGPPVGASAGTAAADDLAVALFTSGSTGVPKAALHTHRGLVYKARVMAAAHGLRADDVVLMPAPLAHISGLLNGILVPGAAGMRAILMEKWDPDRALDIIERARVSFMIGPPTFFVSLQTAPSFTAARVATLRLISSGGAGVTPAFVATASAAFGAVVKRTYGSTEAPTITTSMVGDPPDKARDTDGRATGDAEISLAPDGELLVRGPELCAGYADPVATANAFDAEGWFRTGDLATIDIDGWLTIVGRKKDIIIRGGENIAAAEVEGVLEAHPRVHHAVAVGAPDERLGERVCAFVVADGPFDLGACRAWFAERGVTRFKWPERVVQLDALPLMAAGKPDRAALRARAAADR
jgi:acyl-CoA synthetase (AMP-forming)/AMP-acid ligase II